MLKKTKIVSLSKKFWLIDNIPNCMFNGRSDFAAFRRRLILHYGCQFCCLFLLFEMEIKKLIRAIHFTESRRSPVDSEVTISWPTLLLQYHLNTKVSPSLPCGNPPD